MAGHRARRRPGENREHLLEAGLVEFGLFGYHGASTAAIAARAEVPQPHVYASFTTKQELFIACVVVAVDAIIESGADRPSAHMLRVVHQSVAASRVATLHEALSGELSRLREAVGESEFGAILRRAAYALLDEDRTDS